MLEIVLNKISKDYGNKKILKNINFEIKTNEKVALIGQNGCGKTTIFRLILKEEAPTSGNVFINKDSKIGFLSQYPDESLSDEIVKNIIYSSFTELNKLKERLDKEEEIMSKSSGKELEKSIVRYTNLQEKFISKGGYEIKSKVDKLISAFKIENLLTREYRVLSGGEKTIVNLICILLKEPDILLLDEPTNHLDISMIEWLENYLINCNKTVIIVSHDRYFLDKVVKKVILIDNGEEDIYYGNYTYYIEENERRIMQEFNDFKNQQKQIAAMKESIRRLKEYGRLAYPCGEKFFRRAASIEKRLEKIEVLDNPNNKKSINLNFNFEKRSGNNIIELNRFNYEIGNKVLFNNADLLVKYQDKICIIFEDENKTLIEETRKYFNGYEEHLRSALVKFLFYSEGIYTKLYKLSGGERLRLKLFCLMQQDNNLLILDEPTNHIDINTKEVLEEALNDYKGTIIVISHDRYFINKIATRIVYIESQKLINYIGNYDDYKRKIKSS